LEAEQQHEGGEQGHQRQRLEDPQQPGEGRLATLCEQAAAQELG